MRHHNPKHTGGTRTLASRAGIMRYALAAAFTVLAFAASSRPSSAEEPWRFTTEPYVFFAGLKGHTAIGRAEADVDAKFSDIFKNLKMAAMTKFDATNDRWGVTGDLMYMRLGIKGGVRGDYVELGNKMTILETDGFYRWHIGQSATLDALAGVRYWNIRFKATLAGPIVGATANRSADWADPLVGLRMNVPLAENWSLMFRGDIGGFGVGSSFSWQIEAGILYQVSKGFAITAQYRYLDVDYSRGTPDTPDRFVFDAAMHGPQLGLRFAL